MTGTGERLPLLERTGDRLSTGSLQFFPTYRQFLVLHVLHIIIPVPVPPPPPSLNTHTQSLLSLADLVLLA